MTELKAGDYVWVSDTISDIPDQSYAPGCIMTQVEGQNEIMVSDEAWMPDLPNLAQIARYLAAHPETVDALEAIMNAADAWISEFDYDKTKGGYFDQRSKQQAVVAGLVRAMRGEGSDDER